MKNKVRHLKISVAASVAFLIAYMVAFNDNEDVLSLGGALSIFFCVALMSFFNEREYRAHHPDGDS